ncbi:UNVERIFIED_ORG: myosin-crossreactive antigen [Arthrobacter sp. UYCu721]
MAAALSALAAEGFRVAAGFVVTRAALTDCAAVPELAAGSDGCGRHRPALGSPDLFAKENPRTGWLNGVASTLANPAQSVHSNVKSVGKLDGLRSRSLKCILGVYVQHNDVMD